MQEAGGKVWPALQEESDQELWACDFPAGVQSANKKVARDRGACCMRAHEPQVNFGFHPKCGGIAEKF
jgi:hypothetical protein